VIRHVIDASVAAEYLLRTPLGVQLTALLEGTYVLAPELSEVEVLSVLRRAVLHQQLDEQRAWLALEGLPHWPIDRMAKTVLIREAWQYRHNLSAYDALYVAAARVYDASLLTADGPLARAPALGTVVQNIRMG
jgi:predicted nucleic acid-binding protein